MYTHLYLAIFIIGLIIALIIITTNNKKMDRTHWSIVLLLQFVNFGYLELSLAQTIDSAIIGNTLCFIGGTILPSVFAISLLQSLKLKIRHFIRHILYLCSLVLLFGVRYGSQNGMFFKNFKIDITDRGTLLYYDPGIFLYVHNLYMLLLVVIVITALLYANKYKKELNSIVFKGYLIVLGIMSVGYLMNSLIEPEFQIIPVVYMISLIIAGFCFKLSSRYNADEVAGTLHESNELLHGHMLVHENYTYINANEKAIEMIPELNGINLTEYRGEDNEKSSYLSNFISRLIFNHKSGNIEEDIVYIENKDVYFNFEISDCEQLPFEKHRRLIIEITDVTDQQKYLQIVKDYNTELENEVTAKTNQIRELMVMDRVTNVFSSYGFTQEIQKKLVQKTAQNYDAYYTDVVRMGLYNRQYGDKVGDAIIWQYAQTLKKFAEEDEVIGRLGGNFFLALIRRERRGKFLDLLKGSKVTVDTFEGKQDLIVKSIAGVFEITPETDSYETIMSNIATAVNLAKNKMKKPAVIMSAELMNELNRQRQTLEMIPKCMEMREFKPFYQPKVNAVSHVLCGAEALVRWEHDGQLVPPYRFIPMLEQSEYICNFDFYMLDYVCSDMKRWIEAGMNPPAVSVNFSRRNLGNPVLAEDIYKVIKSYDIPFNLIQIEVTETIDEFPLSYLKGVVEALKGYGISSAIDDFGTGSSSINLIKEVPFDVIKIDKSFIDSITEKDRKILELIITMANQIGADVITEGAEEKEQVDILTSLGCEKIQGYYFDKPLPVKEFEERIKRKYYN